MRRSRPVLQACALLAALVAPGCESGPGTAGPGEAASLPAAADAAPREPLAALPPGEDHRRLDPLEGEWRVEVLDPGTGARVAAGRAALAWRSGGLFLEWRVDTALGGWVVESFGLLGYDPRANEYELLFASGLSGTMSLARGRGDLRDGGLRLLAEERDPASGLTARTRTTLSMPASGTERFEILQEEEAEPGRWTARSRTVYERIAPEEPLLPPR
jgi:hypothetical protein